MTERLLSIAMIGNPWYRYFFADLAAMLKDRYNSAIYVYSPTEDGCRTMSEVGGKAFDATEIMPTTVTYIPRADLDEVQVIETAQVFEEKYGVRYNTLMVSDRHFGRGYAPGGFHHPRSVQSERGTYFDAVHAYNQQFEFWEREFETKSIALIMEINSSLIGAVARHFGALIRNPVRARHKNYYHWATDEYGYCELAARIYNSSRALPEEHLAGVPFQAAMFNEEARRRYRAGGVLREIIIQSRLHLIWRLTGYHKAKLYLYRDQIALAFRRWRSYRVVSGRRTTRLAELRGSRFVFYALHVEPEVWFQARSPEFFNQLGAIISLSRDLPAGVLLAVKEHLPAVGRRPDRYYDQILALKNVVLLHIEEKGQEIVREASAVATICGTVGQEAAVLGKPVVAFGRHNLFNILKHVRIVWREEDLRPALDWALSRPAVDPAARSDGERLLRAAVAAGFDMQTFTARSIKGYDAGVVAAAYERLIESLHTAEM